MSRTLAITGTGTELGKTFVTALLARQLRAHGDRVTAAKPVSSGCEPDAEGRLWSPDGRVLAEAAGYDPDDWTMHQHLSLERFQEPISPHLAAAHAGRILNLRMLTGFCQSLEPETGGYVLAEGIGGVMTPLTENATNLDWLLELDWPVVLVAGTYLGALSHTLTALRCLQQAEAPLAGLVLNRSPEEEEPVAAEELRRTLHFFHPEVPMVTVPRAESGEAMPDLVTALGVEATA